MIVTKRLKLHPLRREDAYLLYQYRRLPNVEKYQSFQHFSYSQAKQVVQMEGPKREPGSYQFGIYLNEWLIGDVFFHFTKNMECFIGYTLNPDYWHQGYAYEAVRASIDYLHKVLDIHQFYAYINPHNTASIQLINKLGFIKQENGIYNLNIV